jgi:hypothetical protein
MSVAGCEPRYALRDRSRSHASRPLRRSVPGEDDPKLAGNLRDLTAVSFTWGDQSAVTVWG